MAPKQVNKSRNIQVIDGASNCTYSIYRISEEQFNLVFPEKGQDIEFVEDFGKRMDSMSKTITEKLFHGFWDHPVDKKNVRGIHGTIFYGLEHKKEYYPTKREDEMINPITGGPHFRKDAD